MDSLLDFVPVNCVVPSVLFKSNRGSRNRLVIQVKGFSISNLGREYYNVCFFGELIPHNGLSKEYCVGAFEISKREGSYSEDNIRITRFRSDELWKLRRLGEAILKYAEEEKVEA